jgi:hypothetical protein
MRIRTAERLNFNTSDQPTPSIEIDLGSILDGESLQSLLRESVSEFADDQQIFTIWSYFTNSINFHEPTSSAFVMALGGKNVLGRIHGELENVPGLRMRYSDYVVPSREEPAAHIEEGMFWLPLGDGQNWYADAELITPEIFVAVEEIALDDEHDGDSEDEQDTWSTPPVGREGHENIVGEQTRRRVTLRTRAARSDASVGSISRTIERMLSLPEGSVLLCGPDKRAMRRDARIGTLRRRWE